MLELLTLWGVSQTAQFAYPILEKIATEVAEDQAQSYVGQAFHSVFSALYQKPLIKATGLALKTLLELMEEELVMADTAPARIQLLQPDVEAFIRQPAIQQILAGALLEPDFYLAPSDLAQAWSGANLPDDFAWPRVAKLFAHKAHAIRDNDPELRETFTALQQRGDSEALKELQGLPPEFDLETYREALVERFGNLNLDSVDTAGGYYAVKLWSVFVPQTVRECRTFRPQLLELPKEHLQRLLEQGEIDEAELRELEKQEYEQQRSRYVEQPLLPVMDLLKTPEPADIPSTPQGFPHGPTHLVILGDPGSGKSSLLRFLALEWARNENTHQRYTQPLPLLIELRDYNRWDCPSGKSFPRYLHEASTWHRLNQQTLHHLLQQENRVVLLLDGLDEVFDPHQRDQVINDIHRFSNQYKHTRVIVTSRVVGYKAQRLRDAKFQDFMLQDLDNTQIEDFLHRWHEVAFSDKTDGERKRERLAKAIANTPSIQMLAGNPLLLTLMTIINRHQELPRDRVLLYQKASEVLLQQWDTERGLADFPGLSKDIDLRAKNAILRRIAYTMQMGKAEGQAANIIHGETLLDLVEDYLREELHFDQARAAANVLIEQLRARNFILCFLGADSYAFLHRTFLEYYCAAELIQRFHVEKTIDYAGLEKIFDEFCRDDDWREILRLICGQIDEEFLGRIVAFLAMRTDLEKWGGGEGVLELPLAIWCLSEANNLSKLLYAGEILWKKSLRMLERICYNQKVLDDLLNAANEIRDRWPIKLTNIPIMNWKKHVIDYKEGKRAFA